MKQPYIIAHPRSFRKAFVRITKRHMVQHTVGLRLCLRIDTTAVWQDVLTEFKLNRKIRSIINASKR